MDTQEKQSQLFVQLAAMFHVAGMQQMGKIKHPVTDKIERNLEAAQNSIDLLDMLKSKTRGNLSGEEEKMLDQIIQDLKLNFVEEAAKPAPDTGRPEESGAEEDSANGEGKAEEEAKGGNPQ
jgi:hypothetical protein